MKQFLLKIASVLYGVAIRIRHMMFDMGLLRAKEYDMPIICVGNITVGGTGKTPAVEMLVEHFSQYMNVAVLSRGYGRKTRGYREVEITDSYHDVGDEPLQIKRKYPSTLVVVCERRTLGISRICESYPETDLIIMDDGYQHRYVKPFVNIIMIDATRPIENDNLLPYGQLRDTVDSLTRANYFIVTKCSEDMTAMQRRIVGKVVRKAPYQQMFFTRFTGGAIHAIFDEGASEVANVVNGSRVIAMSGIGNSAAFNNGLRRRFKVVETIDLEDHHSYRMNDLRVMRQALSNHPGAVIVTTEKDAVKLYNSKKIPAEVRSKMFYESISFSFIESDKQTLLEKIESDLRQFKKSDGTYIRG